MIRQITLLYLLCSCAYAVDVKNVSPESPVTVVELFTSQGCYSCPPADVFLGELAVKENTVTLACHVTYWNYIGWKDTFSRSFCDNRQRQYQSFLIDGNKGVYTPQMIINGRYAGVGSRKKTIQKIIRFDQQQHLPLQAITLAKVPQNSGYQLQITLPVLASAKSHHQRLQLYVFGTTGEHQLPIAKGENGGKKLTYFNPIEYVDNLGGWDGLAGQRRLRLSDDNNIRDWIVVAQVWPAGEILAVGTLPNH